MLSFVLFATSAAETVQWLILSTECNVDDTMVLMQAFVGCLFKLSCKFLMIKRSLP